jgi:hypothetical protein
MARQTVTSDELASLMTQGLQRRIGHQNCRLGAPKIYQEPDEDGCNWSPDVVLRRSGLSSPECEKEAAEVIQWARQRYNVESRT